MRVERWSRESALEMTWVRFWSIYFNIHRALRFESGQGMTMQEQQAEHIIRDKLSRGDDM